MTARTANCAEGGRTPPPRILLRPSIIDAICGNSLDIDDIKLDRIPCRGWSLLRGRRSYSGAGGRETIDEQVDQPRAAFMVNGSQHLTASAGAGRESHQVLSSVGRLTRKAGEWMLMLGLATGVRRARSYVWIIRGGRRLAVVSRRW
jgi:hypothetical protein